MLEAKSSLSRLVAAVQSGAATEIVLGATTVPPRGWWLWLHGRRRVVSV
jgi:hypothetical protein